MGFFSGIRRRIKKLIPKEIRPAIPFIAAGASFIPGIPGLGAISNPFTKAALAKMATDDEADIRDAVRTGIIAAAPTAIGSGLGSFADKYGAVGDTAQKATMLTSAADSARKAQQAIEGAGLLKTAGVQAATDFGIKQAELNEKAIEEYNRNLLEKGVRDKTARRSAIFNIFVNAGYDDDEVNVMLDKYGYADGGKVKKMQKASMSGAMDKYFELLKKAKDKKESKADGGRVGLFMGGDAIKIDPRAANFVATTIKSLREANPEMSFEEAKDQALSLARKEFRDESEDFDASEFSSDLQAGLGGLEAAFGQPLGGMRPEPMRIIPGFAEGGDVDILETEEEEIITPEYLMKEEGVPIGEQVSAPDKMDSLNQLSLMLFNKPIFELTEDQFEMLKEFAADRAAKQVRYEPGKYSDEEIEMYENYKYNMNEQMPGMPIIDIDEFLRMEYGQARMGVARGGPIKTQKPDMEKDTKGKTAAPDYYIKRMEELMDLGYDYDEAGRIAMDYDEYREAIDKGPVGDAYKQGGVIKKKKIIAIGTGKLKDYPGIKKILEMNKKGKKRFSKADGGKVCFDKENPKIQNLLPENVRDPRKMAAEGGLMNLGGKELDLRGGGFVPMGKKEKADDVPARLSKNEFVFTADAVRAAGGGSVQKGADLMYDTMKKLEAQS